MDFEFIRHEPLYDRILLVLTLDRQKMKERILIGEELQIRFRLQGYTDADVLCDVARPLGTMLSAFEHDPDGEWNRLGLMPLREALHSNRWKQPGLEQASGDFLAKKYLTDDPVRMYVALRIWNEYLKAREPRDRESACERFMGKMNGFTALFMGNPPLDFDEDTGKPKRLDISTHIYGSAPQEDTRLDLWYPDSKRKMECVAAYSSLYPLIIYYLNRLNDWGLYFRKCKICGKVFLAKSQRYELCSDKCRKKQSLQNKREFDERARENNYDLLYKNECQNWRNKINKAKKTPGFPVDRLEEMLAAFESFKKEALQRKQAVKRKKPAQRNFQAGFSGRAILLWNWLNQKTDTSAVNHFRPNDFFCPVTNALHCPDPCHLILRFQFFGNPFRFFHLGNDTIQPVLCLFVQIC